MKNKTNMGLGAADRDNAHVRKVQAMRSAMAGGEPAAVSKADMQVNTANMNSAEHARRLVNKLTAGLDSAYPIKK